MGLSLGLDQTAALAQDASAGSLSVVEVLGGTLLEGVGVPLSEMPSNAQRIRASEIEAPHPAHLADLLNSQIGSVSVSNAGGNPYQSDVNYRGFQATSLLGAPVSLSVYFDGVRMNEPLGGIVNWDLVPMNALASVDVLPGSNPMFGLNTLGGALVLATKNGQDHAGRRLGLLAGSWGRRALQMEFGGADEDQRSDYFLAVNWDRQQGFRAHSASDVRQMFGKLRWQGRDGRLEASALLADAALSGPQALPADMLDQPRSAYTWPDTTRNQLAVLSLKGRHAVGEAQEIAGQVYVRQSRSRTSHSNAELDDGCFNDDGSLATAGGTFKCADKAPGGTAVNSVTAATALALGYGRWTSAINTSVVESSTRQSTLGSAFQWSSFDRWLGRSNALALGASFSQSRIHYGQDSWLARLVGYQAVVTPNLSYGFTANGQAPSAANPASFTGSNRLRGLSLEARTRDVSLYLIDTLDLMERLKLTASASFNVSTVRQLGSSRQYLNDDGGYTWTDAAGTSYFNPDFLGAYRAGALASPLSAPTGATAGPESNSLEGRHRYQRLNPALGFHHRLGARQSLYGGYSEAMRAPTSVELSCADPAHPCARPTGFNGDPELKAVVARTLELGGRGAWGQASSWHAALYSSRLSNDIQFIAAPNSTSYGYFANVGGTERRGIELGAQIRWHKLALAMNLGHVRAVYRSDFATPAGQNVVSGHSIPGIPRSTLKLRASHPVAPQWQLGGQFIAVGSQYAHGNEGNSDPAGKVPGYRVVHLDLQHAPRDDLQLTLAVHNLFDKAYATYGLSGVTSIYTLRSQTFSTPAAPRSFWLSLSYRFGGKAAAR